MATNKTILLVEDEGILAMNVAVQLEQEGYQVVQAATGKQAIAKVKAAHGHIDLILMDIVLGEGLDGAQAAAIILQDYDLPILFLTSHTEREIVEKTYPVDSYGFVVKDAGIAVLAASIRQALRNHAARQAVTRPGAQDYLVKTLGGFEMAARAIRHAIDRQKLSKSLQESEKRFSIAFHASPVAQLITVIKTGQILDANQAYCRLVGFERDQLIDRTTAEMDVWMDPEDRQRLGACFEIDGHVSEMEIKFRPHSGEARTLLSSIEPSS